MIKEVKKTTSRTVVFCDFCRKSCEGFPDNSVGGWSKPGGWRTYGEGDTIHSPENIALHEECVEEVVKKHFKSNLIKSNLTPTQQ